MGFYRDCLGGELVLQSIGESPMAGKMPPEMSELILHGSLDNGALRLMGSDMVGDEGLQRGNHISLMLNCSNEAEIRDLYEKLSAGGKRTHPLENTFWGALFGDLVDRYGNQWLLHFEK